MHDYPGRGALAHSRRWRHPYMAALVGVLALAVAACGGGGKGDGVASLGGGRATSTTVGGRQDDRQQALDWARCMRQHGIDLPDPQFSGNDIVYPRPDRAVRNGAKYKAAEQACKQHLPNGGQPGPPNPEKLQRALAFARCMRQHGITTMPDPQVVADGITQQSPPGMSRNDPRLKAAVRACGQGLPGDK
jgi:hypothetical protein